MSVSSFCTAATPGSSNRLTDSAFLQSVILVGLILIITAGFVGFVGVWTANKWFSLAVELRKADVKGEVARHN